MLLVQGAGTKPEPVRTWKRGNSLLYRDSNSDPSAVQAVALRRIVYLLPVSRWPETGQSVTLQK
jgi:hypothetical protein